MNPIDFKSMNMDALLQNLVKLDFDEANLATIKRQLLGELSLRLSAMAPQPSQSGQPTNQTTQGYMQTSPTTNESAVEDAINKHMNPPGV